MKLECKRLNEDVEELNAELEELSKLKRIVEKNLEEALASLEQEREQKHAYKKELDQRLTHDSVFNLQNLASLGFGLGLSDGIKNEGHDNESNENMALHKIEADFASSGRHAAIQGLFGDSPMGDLFSEVHLSEVRKLEKLLGDTNYEKENLHKALEDAQSSLERAKQEILEQKEKIAQMKAHITSVTSMAHGSEVDMDNDTEESEEDESGDPEISAMKRTIRQKERGYTAALKQIQELQEQVKKLEEAAGGDKESRDDLKDQMTKLQNKCLEYEETIKSLQEVSLFLLALNIIQNEI
jgi:protein bicaudal D